MVRIVYICSANYLLNLQNGVKMGLSMRFFELPLKGLLGPMMEQTSEKTVGGQVMKVMRPKNGNPIFLKDPQGGYDKYLLVLILVSGSGAIGIMSDKQSEEAWLNTYRKLKK